MGSLVAGNDISCNVYNAIIKNRINLLGQQAEQLRIAEGTNWTRPEPFTENTNTYAGAGYTLKFPSHCADCSGCLSCIDPSAGSTAPCTECVGQCTPKANYGLNQQLMAKKLYILNGPATNVTSGQMAAPGGFRFRRSNPHGGFTKAEIWRRVALGFTPTGRPATIYGLQNFSKTTDNQFTKISRTTKKQIIVDCSGS